MTTQVDSSTQTQPTAEQHIAEARARWAKSQQEAAEIQQTEAEQARQRSEQMHQQLLQHLSAWLPAWMLEYVQRDYTSDYDTATDFIRVLLPGCSPIAIHFDAIRKTVQQYEAHEPLRVVCSDDWWVKVNAVYCTDLDEAIHLAALWGESYHAMQAEAARRNEVGEQPQPPQPPPAAPDPIDQALALLAMLSRGERLMQQPTASIERNHSTDCTLALGAAGIAIAHHLSRLADAVEERNQFAAQHSPF